VSSSASLKKRLRTRRSVRSRFRKRKNNYRKF
jgi:hypothetical protein